MEEASVLSLRNAEIAMSQATRLMSVRTKEWILQDVSSVVQKIVTGKIAQRLQRNASTVIKKAMKKLIVLSLPKIVEDRR